MTAILQTQKLRVICSRGNAPDDQNRAARFGPRSPRRLKSSVFWPYRRGKTTTMNVLLGFGPVHQRLGKSLWHRCPPAIARQRIGYLPELTTTTNSDR